MGRTDISSVRHQTACTERHSLPVTLIPPASACKRITCHTRGVTHLCHDALCTIPEASSRQHCALKIACNTQHMIVQAGNDDFSLRYGTTLVYAMASSVSIRGKAPDQARIAPISQ